MTEIKRILNHFIANQPILFFVCIIIFLVIIGTICFHISEGRSFFDSFYVTTITMATVGYGDFTPITHIGKFLSIVFGFMGAPIFIGLTGVILQSKFQKVIKHNIHAYHEEIKEAQKVNKELKKETKNQQEIIKELKETIPTEKKNRWKKLLRK